MTQTHGGAVKPQEIHFPGECPQPALGDRIIQTVAIIFLTVVATLGAVVLMTGGFPWSAMGKAHVTPPPQQQVVQQADDTACA